MIEYLKVRDTNGMVLFSGTAEDLSDLLKVPTKEIIQAKANSRVIKGKYRIEFDNDANAIPDSIREHLYDKNGKRKYEYKKGYPNRYKSAACVRFTPL